MELTPDHIDEVLVAITKTKVFGSSKRQYQLLKYLLEETGAGRGSNIKAYSIAIDILDRDESFDDTIDSIVRVEMHRLRKNITFFNMLQNKYKITLSKASFTPKVRERRLKNKHSTTEQKPINKIIKPKPPRYRLSLFIALLVFTFFSVIAYQKFTAVAKVTFAARIIFPSENDGLPSHKNPTAMSLTKEIKYILLHHAFVSIKNSGTHDYRFEIEISGSDSKGDKTATILLYTKTGTLAWSSNYKINDEEKPENIRHIAKEIFDDAFFNDGKATHFHANNLDVSLKRRKLYQCFLDAHSYTLPNVPNYRGKNPLDCLNPKLTLVQKDKNLIHVARANLYLGAHSGNFPVEIQNPLEKADAELKLAQRYQYSSAEYLFNKLRVERFKSPRNDEALKDILKEIQNQYPNFQNAQFAQAYDYAELFADWEKALPLADELLKNTNTPLSHAHIFYIYYYISQNDWENASVSFEKTPLSTSPTVTMLDAAIFCNLDSKDGAGNLKLRLKRHNLASAKAFTHFIKERRMHKSIEENLLKPEMFVTCPLFQNDD